jgi:hypothetical protein
MKWNEAIRLLDDCEKSLRQLMSEAATEGDYGSVGRINELAKAIVALAADGRPRPHEDRTSSGNVPGDATRLSGPAARKERIYPQFFRKGDELVKVGWSKKGRSEYNHRAPRRAVIATAIAIRHAGAKGKLFNGDALLPLKDPGEGSMLPSYQAYVALAWLKHLGIVEQHGHRGGYTAATGKETDNTIATAWPELPEWHG